MTEFDRRGAIMAGLGGLMALAAGPLPPGWIPPKPDRELKVPIVGGSLYVRINGKLDGKKPPLLMIHGGPGGSHASLLTGLALADERAVILYDQLDCGKSDAPNDPVNWTVERFVSEVSAVRDALEIETLHLLGHSWGAALALEYAARTRSLSSLVLQGPLISTARWLDDAALLRATLPADVQATLTKCESATPPGADACKVATDAFYAQFWRREPAPAWQVAYDAAMPKVENDRLYNAMWGPSEFRCTGTLKNYDATPLLSKVRAQTLFMVGEYDEATPAAALEFSKQMAPGQSELSIITGAAHRIQTDRPTAYVDALRKWLAKHDG